MKSYENLEEEFNLQVDILQGQCKHEKSTWMEKWWAMGHSCGYSVLVCENCRKILEENPTAEERAKDKKKLTKELFAQMNNPTIVEGGCMADYDEDCDGKKPDGCMCLRCCKNG